MPDLHWRWRWRAFVFWARRPHRPFLWRYQRMTRGWSDCDAWNLDTYLACILAGGLEWLAENAHGWPGEEGQTYEDWQQELRQAAEWFRYLSKEDIWDSDYAPTRGMAVAWLAKRWSNLWD